MVVEVNNFAIKRIRLLTDRSGLGRASHLIIFFSLFSSKLTCFCAFPILYSSSNKKEFKVALHILELRKERNLFFFSFKWRHLTRGYDSQQDSIALDYTI